MKHVRSPCSAPVFVQVNMDRCFGLKSTTLKTGHMYTLEGGKAATTPWLGSLLSNLSPMQDRLRDYRTDGDPKRLRICFHSECTPSAWLEREATEREKTLSTDR